MELSQPHKALKHKGQGFRIRAVAARTSVDAVFASARTRVRRFDSFLRRDENDRRRGVEPAGQQQSISRLDHAPHDRAFAVDGALR